MDVEGVVVVGEDIVMIVVDDAVVVDSIFGWFYRS